jgi:phospholipase C
MTSITNIVVLMLENRSYDNVLGALYMNAAPPPGQWSLDGLTGNESNPDPNGGAPIMVHSTSAPVMLGGSGAAYPPTCLPIVDPGEPFNDMSQQYLSLSEPPSANSYETYIPTAPGLMQGFTSNYNAQLSSSEQATNVQDIMNYLTPEQLPVTAFLARNFGVCDEWFASAPTQTFANRTFALLAAPAVEQPVHLITRKPDGPPYSYIDDAQYGTDVVGGKRVPSTSIFEQLDNVYPSGMGSASAPNWRVYFHDYPIAALADPYTFNIALNGPNQNVATFDATDFNGNTPPFLSNLPSGTFVSDAVSGLPKFSLIEPRYNVQGSSDSGTAGDLLPNCDHPGKGAIAIPGITTSTPDAPIDAASGELLLMYVYNLLQASPNWATTLFIVTFDEPGGTFDHVAPPLATPPGSAFPAAKNEGDLAANGFSWNVFGGRVPAIVISPLSAAGSTIRAPQPFDHTSIIATAWEAFSLTQGETTSLTARDAAAPSLVPFCNATNGTGRFSGTIVCAPTALIFTGTGTLMLYAGSGSTTPLSASMSDQPSWVTTFTATWNVSTNQLAVAVGVDSTNVSGVVTATFEVSGPRLTTVPVTVTLAA